MREPEVEESALVQRLSVLASAGQPGGDGGLSVAEDPLGGGSIQSFGQRRQHHCDLLRGSFQTVQGGTRRANRKPELQCEAVSWSGERGTFTSFYHIYNDTKITKHSVLQDTIRDRQTYEVTFPVREEYAASWE